MEDKLLTSYSFIASLNENGEDIYETVYIPLFKRAMSIYAKTSTSGKDTDIQKVILDEYGITVPLIITRNLIVAIGKELSRKEKERFGYECFESGKSFKFEKYTFTSLDSSYDRERRQANALQLAFEKYVEAEFKDASDVPSFRAFIDKYKNELSSFLSGRNRTTTSLDIDVSFMPHVRFLQYIESNNDALFKAVERLYIGAIIASFLEAEVDVKAKSGKTITYYLDSKIVLEALDLQNQEDTRPTLELLQLIRDSGGDIQILDITLNEIKGIIENAIQIYDKANPTTTINEACQRNKKNKSWLVGINGRLDEYIIEKLKINFTTIPDSDIRSFSASEDAELLRNIWFKKNAAVHDVIAYLYVRKKRKEDANRKLIQKASCWFISANSRLCEFNLSRKENGYSSEIIMPQELTSLLFLQNPKKFSKKVQNIGLSELIAQTLSDEYPSKDIINEFDLAVKESIDISQEDYGVLLSAVSKESTSRLQRLLEEKNSDPRKFTSNIHEIISTERKKQNDSERKKKEADEQKSRNEAKIQNLEDKNKKLSEDLNELSKTVAQIQQDSKQKIETINQLSEENQKLRLKNWKRPRYILTILALIICVAIFCLYFIAKDWEYNYCAKLIDAIDSYQDTRKSVANIILVIHGAFFIASINALIKLIMIEKEEDKKHWFLGVISKITDKKV